MSEISIKVEIGSRSYPLSVRKDEEEVVRKAAAMINEGIKNLQENYAVKDMQDLLAMTALQLATQAQTASPVIQEDETLKQEVSQLDAMLGEFLTGN